MWARQICQHHPRNHPSRCLSMDKGMSKWAIELGGHEHAGRAEHEFVGRDWCTGSLLLAARFRLQTLISFCSLSSTSCRLRCCVVRHSRWSRFCPFCRFVLGRGTCKDFLCDGAEHMCVHEAVNRIPANLTSPWFICVERMFEVRFGGIQQTSPWFIYFALSDPSICRPEGIQEA